MLARRILPLAVVLAASAVVLTGCIVSPPAPPVAQPTTPTTTQPADPTTSDPAPTDPAPSDPAPTSTGTGTGVDTGSTVTIDGQSVGTFGSTVSCATFSDGALLTSGSEDEPGVVLGTAELIDGAWQTTSFLVTTETELYTQTDEFVPATLANGTFSAEIPVVDIAGAPATLAVTAPCS